jgi:hypothetical protein
LSHANVAVDVAILRIAEAFEKTQDLIAGRILRIGVPQMLEVRNRGDITPEDVLVRTQPDLIRARDELEKRRDQVTREFGTAIDVETKNRLSKELEGVRGRLRKVREDIRLATAKIMGEARIVAATFSRFAIDDRLYQWPAEAILIDEASMAPFPAVLAAAFCARKRLAIFGDFRQLPPIVISTKTEAKTWVGRDAFEIAGIIDAVDEGRDDPRVTLLETQYRMSGEIASLVSDLAYGGRLRTASGVNERNASLAAHSPHSGNPVVFLDSADMDPICLKEQRFGSHSRGNPIHAAIDVVLAEGLILQGCPTVTIVTPYRSQARLISIVIRENKMEKRIRSATVHRFQGSESDAVIVDLVDGPPMSGASHLTGKNRDDSLRLINVALSRAKGKLFIIANVDHIRDTYKASTWMRKLAGRFVSSNEAWRPLSREFALFAKGKNLGWFSRWEEGEAAACAALEACRENLILNLPCELPYSPEFRARLLSVAQRLRKAIIFTTQEIAEELSDTAAELRLLAHPGGFFLLVDNEAAIFGGTSGEGAFIQVKKKRVVEALEEFFLGEMGRRPPPKADIKHALDALCGRCDECGEFRRPRKLAPDDWRLSCPKGHQGPTPLELGEMQRMIDVLNMQCRKCGNAPVLRKGPKGIFLGCSNFSHGCKGALLSLDTLFEEN